MAIIQKEVKVTDFAFQGNFEKNPSLDIFGYKTDTLRKICLFKFSGILSNAFCLRAGKSHFLGFFVEIFITAQIGKFCQSDSMQILFENYFKNGFFKKVF